jgi:hypothetical protein
MAPTQNPAQAACSINAYAARFDGGSPLLDFPGNEFGKILGTSTFGRNDALTNGFETLAYRA